jgi:hypothetical protein
VPTLRATAFIRSVSLSEGKVRTTTSKILQNLQKLCREIQKQGNSKTGKFKKAEDTKKRNKN